jgi:radical SAM protein with 4Fe4S-binding SPASM domain
MDSGNAWENELTYDECCKVIDDLAYHKVKTILFTGGEPLTRNDFFNICDYVISKKINVGVTTNGTMVTDDIIENQFWKFQALRISLDSMYPEEHDRFRNMPGVFDKAITAIKKMVILGYNVAISTCISKKNVGYLDKMADFLEELGVVRWCMPLLSPDGRGKNIASEALEPLEVRDFLYKINNIKQNHPNLDIGIDIPYIVLCKDLTNINDGYSKACPAAVSELAIFANGDISPCFAMVTSAGNIRHDDISEVWRNNSLFKNFRDRSLLKGKCHDCENLMQCGGGCRAEAYIVNNDYLGEDTLCWK